MTEIIKKLDEPKEPTELNDKGCFDLVARAVEHCFTPVSRLSAKEAYKSRMHFANSKLIQVWCDCSYNFEYKKLRKKIIAECEKIKAKFPNINFD